MKNENCLNCNKCVIENMQGYCLEEWKNPIYAIYELEATWCTNWQEKINIKEK